MPRAHFFVTAPVAAPAGAAYRAIADYARLHPRIVPPRAFSELVVEGGSGVGAGTTIRFTMRLFGRTHVVRAAVTEPEPGRVLVETELRPGGVVSTFTVDPVSPHASEVTIATEFQVRGGPLGRLERWLAVRALTPLYHEEIQRLEQVAQEVAGGASPGALPSARGVPARGPVA